MILLLFVGFIFAGALCTAGCELAIICSVAENGWICRMSCYQCAHKARQLINAACDGSFAAPLQSGSSCALTLADYRCLLLSPFLQLPELSCLLVSGFHHPCLSSMPITSCCLKISDKETVVNAHQ